MSILQWLIHRVKHTVQREIPWQEDLGWSFLVCPYGSVGQVADKSELFFEEMAGSMVKKQK